MRLELISVHAQLSRRTVRRSARVRTPAAAAVALPTIPRAAAAAASIALPTITPNTANDAALSAAALHVTITQHIITALPAATAAAALSAAAFLITDLLFGASTALTTIISVTTAAAAVRQYCLDPRFGRHH